MASLTGKIFVNYIPELYRLMMERKDLGSIRLNDHKLHLYRKSDYKGFKIVEISKYLSYNINDEYSIAIEAIEDDTMSHVRLEDVPDLYYTYDEYVDIYDKNEAKKYNLPYELSSDKNHLTFLTTDFKYHMYKHSESNTVVALTDELLKLVKEDIDTACEYLTGEYIEMPKPQ